MKLPKLKALTIAMIGALFIGGIQSAYASTTVSFYAKDAHGSIAGLTDGNGNLTATTLNQYNDYGVNQSNSNAAGQVSINYDPYQYSGEYTDNESGLQPLGNGYRYYDPSLMRFTSPDSYPLLNLYAYGSGNPVMEMDPTGHLSMSWQGGVGMGAGIVSGIALGFLTGGITDFIGVAVAEMLTNAGTSAIGDGITEAFGGKVSAKQWGLDIGLGAAGGLAGAVAGKGLSMAEDAYKAGGEAADGASNSLISAPKSDSQVINKIFDNMQDVINPNLKQEPTWTLAEAWQGSREDYVGLMNAKVSDCKVLTDENGNMSVKVNGNDTPYPISNRDSNGEFRGRPFENLLKEAQFYNPNQTVGELELATYKQHQLVRGKGLAQVDFQSLRVKQQRLLQSTFNKTLRYTFPTLYEYPKSI